MVYPTVVFIAGLLATPLALAALRRFQVMDCPNHRSSHERPTIRGAGIGVAIIALATLGIAASENTSELWILVAVVAALAAVGLVDDLRGVGVGVRLPLQALLALIAVAALLPSQPRPAGILGAMLAVVAVVGYVNAFNFMDGINGIAGLHAAAVGSTWLVAGFFRDVEMAQLLGGVILAAALAFLPYNFPTARGFLGDVGSYFFGGLIAVSGVLLYEEIPLLVLVLPGLPYVADTAWTLVRRVRRGEVWHEAHREHVYQRLLNVGWSHAQSAGLVGLLTAVAGVTAVTADTLVEPRFALALTLLPIVVAVVAYLLLPDWLQSHRRQQPGRPSEHPATHRVEIDGGSE